MLAWVQSECGLLREGTGEGIRMEVRDESVRWVMDLFHALLPYKPEE